MYISWSIWQSFRIFSEFRFKLARNKTFYWGAVRILLVPAFAFFSTVIHADNGGGDRQAFESAATVNVYLNYQSFADAGFPESFDEQILQRATRRAIDSWVQISGMNLNLVYKGLDNGKTDASDGEILIRGVEVPSSGTICPLASASLLTGRSSITFYRRCPSGNLLNWFVFPDTSSSTYNYLGVLLHEMGHSIGLNHNSGNHLRTVMNVANRGQNLYGPHIEDVEDVVEIYGVREKQDVKVKWSLDQGLSWLDVPAQISSIGSATSTMPVSVNRDNDRIIMFFTRTNKKPAYIVSDPAAEQWGNTHVFGGERSIYGTVGHGYDNEYMMAWVDQENNNRIRIFRTADATETWELRHPPATSNAAGTPAIHKLSANTWILVYPKLDTESPSAGLESGRIVSRITTDDGQTWGPEKELYSGTNFISVRGVTVTSDGPDHIRIGFSQASNGFHSTTGQPLASSIITMLAHLDENNELKQDGWGRNTSVRSNNEPAFTKTVQTFILGYRGDNSEIITRTASEENSSSALTWRNKRLPVSKNQIVGPTVAARRNTDFVFLFYLESN